MKKILIFSLAYYPKHIGGAEVAIKEITDRMALSEVLQSIQASPSEWRPTLDEFSVGHLAVTSLLRR